MRRAAPASAGATPPAAGTTASRAWAAAAVPCSVMSAAETRACTRAAAGPADLAADAAEALAAGVVAVDDVREPMPVWSGALAPGSRHDRIPEAQGKSIGTKTQNIHPRAPSFARWNDAGASRVSREILILAG